MFGECSKNITSCSINHFFNVKKNKTDIYYDQINFWQIKLK